METVLFFAFMAVGLGLSLWLPVLLPLAIGGVSLFLGLVVVRDVSRRGNGNAFYPVAVFLLAAAFLALSLRFAFTFPVELSGKLFYRDVLPIPVFFR